MHKIQLKHEGDEQIPAAAPSATAREEAKFNSLSGKLGVGAVGHEDKQQRNWRGRECEKRKLIALKGAEVQKSDRGQTTSNASNSEVCTA